MITFAVPVKKEEPKVKAARRFKSLVATPPASPKSLQLQQSASQTSYTFKRSTMPKPSKKTDVIKSAPMRRFGSLKKAAKMVMPPPLEKVEGVEVIFAVYKPKFGNVSN